MKAEQAGESRFRPVNLAILFGLAAIAAQWDIWRDIVGIGLRDSEASHILVVPLIVGWLIFARRKSFQNWTIKHSWFGIVFILGAFAAQRIGYQQGILALWHSAAILTMIGAVCSVLGVRVFSRFGPAILAMGFMIPIPGLLRIQISAPLQTLSAIMTEQTLNVFGAQVERAGNVLIVNGEMIAIAEACNGLRMLAATALVVYLFCFTVQFRQWQRLSLLALVPVIVLVLNIIRLVITVLLFGHVPSEVAESFHDISGWVIPLGFMFVLFGAFSGKRGSIKAIPVGRATQPSIANYSHAGLALVMILFMGFVNFHKRISPLLIDHHHERVSQIVDEIPYTVGDWIGTDGKLHQEERELLHLNAALRRHFVNTRTKQKMTLLILQSRNARDLVGHEPGVCYVGQGWEKTSQTEQQWSSGRYTITGIAYEFEKESISRKHRMQVFNILVTPLGRTTGSMTELAKVASDHRLKQLGAVGIQFITNDRIPEEEWQKISEEFIRTILPVIRQYRKVENVVAAEPARIQPSTWRIRPDFETQTFVQLKLPGADNE